MITKYQTESFLLDLDCSNLLSPGETITSTPVVSVVPALTGQNALIASSTAINTAPVTYQDGLQGKPAGVIQVRLDGGSPVDNSTSRSYTLVISFATSLGNVLETHTSLVVNP